MVTVPEPSDVSTMEKCLEFTHMLTMKGSVFKLDVKIGTGFSFFFSSMEPRNPHGTVKFDKKTKKQSPSTIRRNKD